MINKAVKLYAFTFPLNVFTVSVNSYHIAIPTILSGVLLVLLILNNRPLDIKPFMAIVLFLAFALISTMSVHGFNTYIYSLLVFGMLSLPLAFKFEKRDVQGYEKYLVGSFFITVPFAFYDVGVTLFNLVPLESFLVFFNQSTNSPLYAYLGFYRVKSTFMEPSYYGIYLSLILYTVLFYRPKGKKLLLAAILTLAGLTLSLTAISLCLFVLVIYFIRTKRLNVKYAVLIITLFMLIPQVTELLANRVNRVIDSVVHQNYTGSEGARANSLVVMVDYLINQPLQNSLMGEGYSYYDEWLIDKFYGQPLTGFSRGHIFNAFSVIGISTGIIGLVLYSNIFVAFSLSKYFTKFDIVYHILVQFSLALLVGYLFWGVLLTLKFVNTNSLLEKDIATAN